MMRLYGIQNCSTVKKARDWLAHHEIAVAFHDFKKHGLDEATAQSWLQQRDWVNIINRKSMTWRALSDEQKQQINDNDSAIALMKSNPSVIKRPILEQDGKILLIGFDEAAYIKRYIKEALS
jgi:Spx/MgsR family transcriptional regulator